MTEDAVLCRRNLRAWVGLLAAVGGFSVFLIPCLTLQDYPRLVRAAGGVLSFLAVCVAPYALFLATNHVRATRAGVRWGVFFASHFAPWSAVTRLIEREEVQETRYGTWTYTVVVLRVGDLEVKVNHEEWTNADALYEYARDRMEEARQRQLQNTGSPPVAG